MDSETKVRNDREKKQRRKKIRRVIITILIIALVIVGIYIYNYRISNGVFPWQNKAVNSFTPTTSQTTVREETYTTSIDVSGSVVAIDTQKVQFRATGSVTSVLVKEGDRVTKGQLLATLDDSDQQYEIANLEKQLESAKKGGSTSNRDIELMQMRLDNAKKKLNNLNAYADFDGVVVSVSIRQDDYY